MKLGMLYEVQIPKPWTEGIEARTYNEVLEQVTLADKIGWDYVWAVEHHLLPEWSHCPAPEVLFGALSQVTKNIRIGHGIALVPRNFNHALRVAERAAVLDILTGGRVELGTGRAVTLQELDGFEVDPDETQPLWEEGMEILVKAFRDELLSHKGRFYNIPESYVVPKPVQKPHPPLWMAGTNPDTFAKAGENGLGMLGFVTGTPEEVKPRVDAYKDAVRNAKPIGEFVNNNIGVLIQTYCHEDRDQAIKDVEKPLGIVAELAGNLFLPWAEKGKERDIKSYQYLTDPGADPSETRTGAYFGDVHERVENGMVAVGTPDDIVELFQVYEDMGVDQMICWVQFGGLEHDKIMRSLKLMGEEVVPRVKAFRAEKKAAAGE